MEEELLELELDDELLELELLDELDEEPFDPDEPLPPHAANAEASIPVAKSFPSPDRDRSGVFGFILWAFRVKKAFRSADCSPIERASGYDFFDNGNESSMILTQSTKNIVERLTKFDLRHENNSEISYHAELDGG